MRTLKLTGVFMILLLMLTGISSCSNENDATGNIPTQLIRTWYLGDGTTITFNADGTGVYTETDGENTAQLMRTTDSRATQHYPFTYSYEAEGQSLIIHAEGETIRWTIVSLTDNRLEIKDEDGETISLKNAPGPDTEKIDILLLYKTWLSEESLDTYTFQESGEGNYNPGGEAEAVPLTFEYEKASCTLTLHTDGKVFRWNILSLTNDTLKVQDADGDTLVFIEYANAPAWLELLYGKWGCAGKARMKFTNEGGQKLFTLYEGEGKSYTVPFKYDQYNRIYFFEGEEWGTEYWQVKKVTQDVLIIPNIGKFFRIPEPDELVVGNESLLYVGTWTGFDGSDVTSTWKFQKDSQTLVWEAEGDKITAKYTYDATSHQLTITADGEQEIYRITKLTDRVLYLNVIENGKVVDYMEFRIL